MNNSFGRIRALKLYELDHARYPHFQPPHLPQLLATRTIAHLLHLMGENLREYVPYVLDDPDSRTAAASLYQHLSHECERVSLAADHPPVNDLTDNAARLFAGLMVTVGGQARTRDAGMVIDLGAAALAVATLRHGADLARQLLTCAQVEAMREVGELINREPAWDEHVNTVAAQLAS